MDLNEVTIPGDLVTEKGKSMCLRVLEGSTIGTVDPTTEQLHSLATSLTKSEEALGEYTNIRLQNHYNIM